MRTGVVFNVQRFSLHDGPGIRTTVFLKGCALSCSWCHNPESQSPWPEVLVNTGRCIRCGACVEACPEGLPIPSAGRAAEDLSHCDVCGACVEACPTEARQIAGHEVAADELLAELRRDRVFFDQSDGGVTFSGGEPFHQAPFLVEMLERCRAERLHTAVDTCGYASTATLLEAARLADLFLYDLKLADADRHRACTGQDNALILRNLETLAAVHRAIWLRVPVIPGVNDDRENLDAIARIASSLAGVARICLLPYHKIGRDKLERLGRDVATKPLQEPSAELMRAAAARFEAVGLTAQIGG